MARAESQGDPSPAECALVSRRFLPFGRERVWRALADPARLALWWGPKGFTNTFHEFDLRPEGRWRFVMRGPDGAQFAIDKVFVEVVEPERIVLDHLDPIHGFRMTMTLGSREGGTDFTWRMVFASADEFARVQGFIRVANEQNFDRLEAHLAATASGG